jgi:hypothetical protein
MLRLAAGFFGGMMNIKIALIFYLMVSTFKMIGCAMPSRGQDPGESLS